MKIKPNGNTELKAIVSRAADAQEPLDPFNAYLQTMKKAQAEYRKGLSASFSKATKIEIYLLDFDVKHFDGVMTPTWKLNVPKDQFPIGPSEGVARILKTKVLTGEEMKKLLPALEAAVGVEKDIVSPLCHFPIHGVRVWEGEELIFETSFCWMCENFSLRYPDFREKWVGIEGTRLKNIIKDLMPIPAAEIERFKKQYKGVKIDLSY